MDKIVIKDIVKNFDGKQVLGVENLEIDRGEIVALIGKNGSGKSTFIKLISGILYQDEGEINVFGISNKDEKIKKISKFVLESGKGYYDYLSARENIKYFLALNSKKYSELLPKIQELCDDFEFTEHLDKNVSQLSQGNRQKLSIIMSILMGTDSLCLDEPTNGLDLTTSNFLLTHLKMASEEQKKTIIMTTHDLMFIKSIDARKIVLKDGKIILDSKKDEFFFDKNLKKYVFRVKEFRKDELYKNKNVRFEINDNDIFLIAYDESAKETILKSENVLSFSEEDIDAYDIYYKVINYDE